MEFFYGLVFFLVWLSLILYLPLSFDIRIDLYYLEGIKYLSLTIQARLWFLTIWKRQRELSDEDPRLGLWDTILLFWLERREKAKQSATKSRQEKPDRKRSIYAFILQMQGKITVQELSWASTIGGQDAMKTAIMTGSLWACKGALLTFISRLAPFKHLHVQISPDFNQPTLRSQLQCIISSRPVYIIYVALLMLLKRIRWWFKGWIHNRRTTQVVP